MNKNDITIEMVKKPTTKSAGLWLVKERGNTVGLLEKFQDSRTDTHPWKAFRGFGMNRLYLGAYFENEGGQKAAIERILGFSLED